MFSYKFIIRPERNNGLYLRITKNRKLAEINLTLNVSPDKLEDALSFYPKKENKPLHLFLQNYRNKLEDIKIEILNNATQISLIELKKFISDRLFGANPECSQNEVRGEFVEWYEKFALTHPAEGTRTRKDYLHTLSRIRDYDKDIDKRNFKDITVAWLDNLDIFWASTMSTNSRNHHMRNIRAVVKYAIRNDLDIRNPFDRFKIKREETAKRSLDIGTLRQLFTYEVEPYAEIYRDMFKLSFMLIGINPIDLFRLNNMQKGRISYRRAKTHKLYSIKVEQEALEIINKYSGEKNLLNLADRWNSHDTFAAACNRAIRNIGAPKPAPGRTRKGKGLFNEVTLYWARHTWATIAAELDIPDAVISQALGHSSDTNSVTAIYIKRNEKKVDEANRRVLDYVLYDKF